MDRLERLVNLVAALLDAERPLSREQIHQRVGGYASDTETFRRNFERDKDLLRQMGLPLVLEPLDPARADGPQGYRIPRERYELPDPGLTDDELDALRLAGSAVWVEGGWSEDPATSALRKLAAPTGDASARASATTLVPTDERVATAFAAVAARQSLAFRYRGQPRVVDPWHLSFRRGQWYLSAWDHARAEQRSFRLDRVEGALQPTGPEAAFTRPPAAPAMPPPWRMGDDPEVVADLHVDADQAPWAVREVGEQAVVERGADGSVRLAVPVTSRAGFRSFVLGFLDHAVVAGPPELRQEVVGWLERVASTGG
ncbi:MAG TPA: WYL domain-containing protein [Acidimicrobiales bacterium]|nr:WYL domain-containing protein [Acidimicrobiales bacterium]